MPRILAGLDLGGTKCAVCYGDDQGRILDRHQFPTPSGPGATLEALAEGLTQLGTRHPAPAAIGISCGGPLDSRTGVVQAPPNLPGWRDVAVVDYFATRFGLPTFLRNDANAGALAEWIHGAGRGCRNLMFCTMGTGFGCGLILEGRLYEGANGNAGELGHVRLAPEGPIGFGKAGSVEGFCSGGGLARWAETTLGRTLTAKDLAEAARKGDPDARNLFDQCGARLGQALAIAVDLLNLDRIVVGGLFIRCEDLLRPAMERVLGEESLGPALDACRVVPAGLGESIGDAAALAVAAHGLQTGDLS